MEKEKDGEEEEGAGSRRSYLGKTSLPGSERRGTSRPIPGPRCNFLDRTSMGFSAG